MATTEESIKSAIGEQTCLIFIKYKLYFEWLKASSTKLKSIPKKLKNPDTETKLAQNKIK
jgi:hypothetical protein